MTDISSEMQRQKLARDRRKRSKTVVFQKICKGLYISHEWGMSLHHEAVWSAAVGRKWELTWSESYLGLMVPTKRSQKFDTIKDAREHANALAARSR